MSTLAQNALLIDLHISAWTNSKHDKSITEEVEQNHNAHDAGRFNKVLIKKTALKPIRSAISRMRTYHEENTLPWDDGGRRLLPVTHHLEYMGKMKEFENEFQGAVSKFISNYPELIDDAKQRLNGMFVASDYPSQAELPAKFGVKKSVNIVTTPKGIEDVRISVSEEQIEQIKESVRKDMHSNITIANADIFKRMNKVISHMIDKLDDREAKFKDSLVENIKDLIDLMPKLNFTKDQNITDICNEMKKLVVDPDLLRNDANLRAQTAKNAKDILSKFYL